MKYLIEPWKHQLDTIEVAKDLDSFALFFEMGAGKTMTCINILRHKYAAAGRLLRTLVLCPPIVIDNWKREWAMHSKVPPHQVVTLTGSGKLRLRAFMEGAYETDPVTGIGQVPSPRIFVTNYESLLMEDLFKEMLLWKPEVMVCDESQRLKSMKADRTKFSIKLSQSAKHVYILSGSPILNSPLDLFTQYLILDKGRTFGKNFFAFRGTYFWDRNAGMPRDRYFPKWEIRQGALEEINKKLQTTSKRITKAECMSLPPLVQQTITVEMSKEQRKMYLEMKQEFLTYIDGVEVVATMALSKLLRLMQIASGFAKTVTGKEIAIQNTPKMLALKELLQDLTPDHKVIVWAAFKENYQQIRKVCDEIGIKYTEVHGDVHQLSVRNQNVDAFNTDPSVRVLIGNAGSAGIGINLVSSDYAIFFSKTYSLEHSLQAEARNHRGGSEIHSKITRIDLVSKDSIEEIITKRLVEKQDISAAILGDIKKELTKEDKQVN